MERSRLHELTQIHITQNIHIVNEETVGSTLEHGSGMLDTPTRIQQFGTFVRKADTHIHGVILHPLLYHIGEMMNIDDHVPASKGTDFLQLMLQKRFAIHRNQSLGHAVGERFEPGTQSGRKDHGTHRA